MPGDLDELESIRELGRLSGPADEAADGKQINRAELPGFLGGTTASVGAAIELMRRIGNRALPGDPFGQDALQGYRQAFPTETSIAEILPALATAAVPGGLAVQTGLGAAYGAATADDALSGGITGAGGAALGYGIGSMAGRVASKLAGVKAAISQTDEAGRLLGRLQDLGFDLTPGQITGSGTTRMVEAGLKSQPFTSGAFSRIAEKNQRNLNRLAAKTIGMQADNVGVVVRDAAADQLGKVFDEVGEQMGTVHLSETLVEDIAARGLPGRFLRDVGLPEKGTAELTGQKLMSLRSRLGKASRAAWRNGDDVSGFVLDDIVEELDSLANLPPETQQAWRVAREQWRNLIALERGSAISAEGSVNAASLLRSQRTVFGERPAVDRLLPETVDLLDATRGVATKAFGDIVPTSGTAERRALAEAAGLLTSEGLAGLATLGLAPAAATGVLKLGTAAPVPAAGRAGAALGRAAAGEFERERQP